MCKTMVIHGSNVIKQTKKEDILTQLHLPILRTSVYVAHVKNRFFEHEVG